MLAPFVRNTVQRKAREARERVAKRVVQKIRRLSIQIGTADSSILSPTHASSLSPSMTPTEASHGIVPNPLFILSPPASPCSPGPTSWR